ncbi:sigma-70 family RNA polymerase sigma factor [Streptomyces sp. NPDC091219]|uniref:sigma-70 family RNA polymerase sigma factor n=1 Tax=Streptomyces sp. NPDC091219 TaxID=3155193 RepID=UPI0034505614
MTVIGSMDLADKEEQVVRESYEVHGAELHGYVVRLLNGDRHKAEDIVQETLLRFWLKQDQLDGRRIRPWLFRVARNLVIDAHRSRGARPVEVCVPESEELMAAEGDEIQQMLNSVILHDALRSLSEAHREVLRQTFLVGRTAPEAAEVLGLPTGTVKSRVFYALRAMRQALHDRDVEVAPDGALSTVSFPPRGTVVAERRLESGSRAGLRLPHDTDGVGIAISKSWVDAGSKNAVIEHSVCPGIDVAPPSFARHPVGVPSGRDFHSFVTRPAGEARSAC